MNKDKSWKPKYKEYCVFWSNTDSNVYIIAKFDRMDPIWDNKYQIIGYGTHYDNVAPLDQLTTIIQNGKENILKINKGRK